MYFLSFFGSPYVFFWLYSEFGIVFLGIVKIGIVKIGIAKIGIAKIGIAKIGIVKIGIVILGISKIWIKCYKMFIIEILNISYHN